MSPGGFCFTYQKAGIKPAFWYFPLSFYLCDCDKRGELLSNIPVFNGECLTLLGLDALGELLFTFLPARQGAKIAFTETLARRASMVPEQGRGVARNAAK